MWGAKTCEDFLSPYTCRQNTASSDDQFKFCLCVPFPLHRRGLPLGVLPVPSVLASLSLGKEKDTKHNTMKRKEKEGDRRLFFSLYLSLSFLPPHLEALIKHFGNRQVRTPTCSMVVGMAGRRREEEGRMGRKRRKGLIVPALPSPFLLTPPPSEHIFGSVLLLLVCLSICLPSSPLYPVVIEHTLPFYLLPCHAALPILWGGETYTQCLELPSFLRGMGGGRSSPPPP